jgi:hypothetical protein
MLEYTVSFVVAGLIGAISAYAIVKRALNMERIVYISEEIIDNMLEKATQDAETQKRIYVLGALLGQGIKSGIGLQKTSGKFKMEDIISMAVGQFLQGGKLGQIFGSGQTPQTSNTEMTL